METPREPTKLERILALAPIPVIGEICAKKVCTYHTVKGINEPMGQLLLEFEAVERERHAMKCIIPETCILRMMAYVLYPSVAAVYAVTGLLVADTINKLIS